MVEVFGVGAMIAVFAFHLAWIARSAHNRGWSLLASMSIAFGAGALGVLVGRLIGWELYRYATRGDDPSYPAFFLGVLALPGSIIAPLATSVWVISRLPARVGRVRNWPVLVMNRGPGSVQIGADSVRLAWAEQARVIPVAELRGVEVDGECVRLTTTSGDSFALLPSGGADHRDGRIAKSKALAAALVAARE